MECKGYCIQLRVQWQVIFNTVTYFLAPYKTKCFLTTGRSLAFEEEL
jgi:hypothetical protein